MTTVAHFSNRTIKKKKHIIYPLAAIVILMYYTRVWCQAYSAIVVMCIEQYTRTKCMKTIKPQIEDMITQRHVSL